jgi:hypothetical protein
MPDYGDVAGVLTGRAGCVEPTNYAVAVYIFVEGWWTKPTFAEPLTVLASDGSWSTDVVTGGADQFATRFAAFLVPAAFSPPLLGGEPRLPQILFDNAVAHQLVERPAPAGTLILAGCTWQVKTSAAPAGSGPNYFSDRPEDVWVADQGRLHLRIVLRVACADIPPAGTGNAHINLWLVDGAPPGAGQEIEVVVTAFDFTPAS